MDDEVKGRIVAMVDVARFVNSNGFLCGEPDEMVNAILALVVAERDAMKELAIKHMPWSDGRCSCGFVYDSDYHTNAHEAIARHIRRLTPSTAQSREREIRRSALEECRQIAIDERDSYDKRGGEWRVWDAVDNVEIKIRCCLIADEFRIQPARTTKFQQRRHHPPSRSA